MALSKLGKDMKIVAKLDDEPNDRGGLSAHELKEAFDEGGEALKEYLNGTLIPELETAGVLAIVRSSDLAALKFLRLNADKAIETSVDGKSWTATGSSGHLILGPSGVALPQRSRMQFANCVVEDNGTVTVVRGVTGPRGATGAQGVQGVQGDTGGQGPTGKAIIPEVNQDTGLMSFKAGEAGAVPSPVYVRGPQGAPGVQGQQGEKGVIGDQGLQGVQGVQGLQGGTGEDGPEGKQGPQGLQGMGGEIGPRGPEGPQGPRGGQGIQGEQGPAGIMGPQGSRGDNGPEGDKGDSGPQGVPGKDGGQGPQGGQGVRGEQGIPGPGGAQGVQGVQGLKGDRGLDGRSFEIEDVYPTLAQLQAAFPLGAVGAYKVTANGELYIWSEANVAWQSIGALQGPEGPRGQQGGQGVAGPQGEIGPQGPQGIQGIQGELGPLGAKGDKGEKGDTGSAGPLGPKGDTGDRGLQGPAGVQGPKGDQGVAGAKGTTGATGPQGVQGAKGDPGAAGGQGAQGVQGVQGPQGPQGNPTTVNGKSGSSITLTAEDVGAVALTGGTMTGPISMGYKEIHSAKSLGVMIDNGTDAILTLDTVGKLKFMHEDTGAPVPIRGVTAPTLPDGIANKQYVDEAIAATSTMGILRIYTNRSVYPTIRYIPLFINGRAIYVGGATINLSDFNAAFDRIEIDAGQWSFESGGSGVSVDIVAVVGMSSGSSGGITFKKVDAYAVFSENGHVLKIFPASGAVNASMLIISPGPIGFVAR